MRGYKLYTGGVGVTFGSTPLEEEECTGDRGIQYKPTSQI